MTLLLVLRAALRRDFALARSYRVAFVLDAISAVFNIALFYFLGRLVQGTGRQIPGSPEGYFPFALIGIATVQTAVPALASAAARIRTEQTTGTLETVAASPAPLWLSLSTGSTYEVLEGTVQALILLTVAAVGFGVRLHVGLLSLLGAALALGMTTAFMAAMGLVLAALTLLIKQASNVISFVVSGLTLIGAIYFPLTVLPQPLHVLGAAIPFTQGLAALRAALLVGEVHWAALGYVAVTVVAAWLVAIRLLDLAADHAKRRGSLAQY